MASQRDYLCTTCGRVYRGPHASKGYPRSVMHPFPVWNGFCPRCRAEGRRVAVELGAHGFWQHAFNTMTRNYPGGKRAAHLRRASQPNPFRSRSEPIKRARKAKAKQRKRGK